MLEKKKKIIIGTIIIGIILIIAIIVINNRLKNENKDEINSAEIEDIQLMEVLDIKDTDKIKYEKEKTNEEVATKYATGNNKYKLKANVKMQETQGEMIYIRGIDNINVYKTEYNIDKYGDKNTQVREIIQTFEENCKNYVGINEDYKETEQLYGENKEKFEVPIEESIYNQERLYSKTYKNEDKEYDINFYKKDNKIICELVEKI